MKIFLDSLQEQYYYINTGKRHEFDMSASGLSIVPLIKLFAVSKPKAKTSRDVFVLDISAFKALGLNILPKTVN